MRAAIVGWALARRLKMIDPSTPTRLSLRSCAGTHVHRRDSCPRPPRIAVTLTVPSAQRSLRRRGTENGEWRTLGGDIGHTRYSPRGSDHARQLRNTEGGVALQPGRRGRPHDRPRHTQLCRWQALQRGRSAPPCRGDGPDHRQAAVELGRASNLSLEVLRAHGLRQGRDVRRDQRQGGRLHHDAGLLPGGVGRRDRPAAAQLGQTG